MRNKFQKFGFRIRKIKDYNRKWIRKFISKKWGRVFQKAISKWQKDKKFFWASQFNEKTIFH
jgi:hypothetical protein